MLTANIISYLKSLSKEPVCYFPNPGNAGDALIASSTFALFKECEIEYEIVSFDDDLAGRIILYGGGGNLVSGYGTAAGFIKKFHRGAKKLVLLPHTIQSNEELLGKLQRNADIICREYSSYQYVRKIKCKANVLLMDDLGFSLDVKKFMDTWQRAAWTKFKIKRNLFRNLKILYFYCQLKVYRGLSSDNQTRNILNAFRKDKEKTSNLNPFPNIDVSNVFGREFDSEETAAQITWHFLKFLDQFDEINTNRLHVCIGGILLKKHINLYPNNYYKNKSVYEFSIKNKISNVKWFD